MCMSLNVEPKWASFFMKVCLRFTSELVYFCMFQAALQAPVPRVLFLFWLCFIF